jgi:DNA (cytosine-5)-methyltransferase 1
MKHLGDITQINGANIEPVDVIVGGSPCQDLSLAGKRAGLSGEQSGLFMEQIRIIKEMRNATNNIRPRYMVWENVPGAFSSNKGEDFRAVLEETARVADSNAVIPRPPKNKWANAGCIMGDGWSIAWRVLDAQFWGVPQRRRRIALVADFRGESAPEILFERAGLQGDITESGTEGKGTSGGVEGSIDTTVAGFSYKASPAAGSIGFAIEQAPSPLSARQDASVICMATQQGGAEIRTDGKAPTLTAAAGMSGNNQPVLCAPAVYDARGNGDGSIAPTMTGDHQNRVTDYTGIVCDYDGNDIAETLDASYYKGTGSRNGREREIVAQLIAAVDCRSGTENPDINGTLQAKPNGGTSLNLNNTIRNGYAVRRLTPLECTRLQGYPDGWVDIGDWRDDKGKLHKDSDSAKYKALGNSIALPPWRWLLRRMAAHLPEKATLGSLFDGIGGFPLLWSEIHGASACKWASEIEPFCIAVTKYHFRDGESAGILPPQTRDSGELKGERYEPKTHTGRMLWKQNVLVRQK